MYAIPALNVKIDGKNCHGNPLALKVLTVPVDTVHPNQFYPPKTVQENPFLWSEWSFAFLVELSAVNRLWSNALSAQPIEEEQAYHCPHPHHQTCACS